MRGSAYRKFSLGKSRDKSPQGRPTHICEDDIKTDHIRGRYRVRGGLGYSDSLYLQYLRHLRQNLYSPISSKTALYIEHVIYHERH
jgi:hypothetical protein